MYYCPGAAHAPHHVPKEWADKYKGKFDDGWDKLRERTFARQKELGTSSASQQEGGASPQAEAAAGKKAAAESKAQPKALPDKASKQKALSETEKKAGASQ